MPTDANYQSDINRLNQEIARLKSELQRQQLEAQNYKQSLSHAKQEFVNKPTAKDLNPIIQQIKNKNLSMREKQSIMFPDLYPSMPEDVYYQWIAPSRLTIKRDRQWYWTLGLVLMIIVVLAVLVSEFMWIAVALAFFFAIYVNASVPAEDTLYRLTRQGIEVGEGDNVEIYAWGQLLEYAYYYKSGTEILYVETIIGVPPRIQILFSQEDRRNINMIMEANLPYRRPPKKQGWLLRMSEGIYIPQQDFRELQEKIDEYYNAKYAEIILQLKKEGRIPEHITVEDIRTFESAETLKLVDQLKEKQEESARRAIGL